MSQFIEMFYNGKYTVDKLREHIDVIRGVSYKPSDVYETHNENTSIVLRSNNIEGGQINFDDLVYVSTERVSELQLLRVGDIVMCGSNGSKKLVGKAAMLQETPTIRTSFGAFCLGIRCKPTLVPEYLATYFQTSLYRDEIEQLGSGSNILNIKPDHIYDLEVPIPLYDEQMAFVSIVRQADKSEFVGFKSQFIEMFGNQNTNDKQWTESLVKDEFKLSMGKTPARSNPKCWEKGTHRWISISDMATYTRYTGDTSEYITEYAITDSGIKAVPKGTIIMSFKLSIGRTAITSEDIYTNEAIMAFADFDEKKFNIDFLHFLIANKNWLLGAKQAVQGQTLNKESIGNAKIIIPPIEMQEEFASIYNQADKSEFELRKSIEAIDQVIKSLINN